MKLRRNQTASYPTVHNIYTRPGVMRLSGPQRTAMTTSCRDTDYIPKVKGAGKMLKNKNGATVQRMHNGLLVEKGGYYGDWMTDIITDLRGHHEPQEEKVFYEVLKKIGRGGTMIELGAHWAYYSLWFNKEIRSARNFCFEPDPGYLEGGKRNAHSNTLNLSFTQAATGKKEQTEMEFAPETMPGKQITVPVLSVDKIISANRLAKVDLLHMDIQGAELDALDGAKKAIAQRRIRFVFVSTHHHSISHDPLTHIKCLKFLEDSGAHIIANHSVHESYSGDGLIVASFSPKDKNFKVDVSANHSGNGLFIETEVDLAELARAYVVLYDMLVG